MTVVVRPFDATDRPGVVELLTLGLREQEVFAATVEPPEDDGFVQAEMAEHLEGLDAAPEGWRVAVDADRRVVGLLWNGGGHEGLGPYASVRQIIVAPRARGEGVGTALLRTAEAEARATDAVMMLISAFRTNPAWRLYRALGFTDFPAAFRLDPHPEHVVLWKCFRPESIAGVGTTIPALRALRAADAGPLSRAFTEIGWSKPESIFEGEIMDLNVLPRFRRRGLGAWLMAAAEQEAWMRAPIVGLRLGLHPGYGAAQRLYVRRGYVPDGTGVVVGGKPVAEGAEVLLDDEPTLRMTKRLAP